MKQFKFLISCNSYSFPKTEVATSKGRIAQTTNVIMGGTVTDDTTDEWLVLDKKVLSLFQVGLILQLLCVLSLEVGI